MFEELLKKLREMDKEGKIVNEEFVNSLKTIFEAAVTESTGKALEEKKEELEEAQEKAVEEFKTDTLQQLDEYLNYVVTEYMDENRVTIEEGLRGQLALETVGRVSAVLTDVGITITDDAKATLVVAESKIKDLKEEHDKMFEQKLESDKALTSERALRVFNEESQELTDEQIIKTVKLCEDFDVDDVEEFRSKVKIIVETVSNAKKEEDPKDLVVEGLKDIKPEPHEKDKKIDGNKSKRIIAIEDKLTALSFG